LFNNDTNNRSLTLLHRIGLQGIKRIMSTCCLRNWRR